MHPACDEADDISEAQDDLLTPLPGATVVNAPMLWPSKKHQAPHK